MSHALPDSQDQHDLILPDVMQEILSELHLEKFALSFQRLGVISLEDLASMRCEELLGMGMSMVQCHLFLSKVSEALPSPGGFSVQEVEVARDDVLRALSAGDGSDEKALQCILQPGRRRRRQPAHLQDDYSPQHMPPPSEAACRKRAHSSHLSTGPAVGSERPTGSSASATDSEASEEVDLRVRKRLRLPEEHLGRQTSSSMEPLLALEPIASAEKVADENSCRE
eukprot:TRINITY_DN105027_c0_g1_i1.p1 TRINITY_DN105027_c0_g1~~TRINITY_DN105027_c0_g1_i1.p1  ORF type:complete len:226 (-),score=40.29 TRINITY_DN105027_c0_g1_i1:48-725(-)